MSPSDTANKAEERSARFPSAGSISLLTTYRARHFALSVAGTFKPTEPSAIKNPCGPISGKLMTGILLIYGSTEHFTRNPTSERVPLGLMATHRFAEEQKDAFDS